MRNLAKEPKPQVLVNNEEQWTAEYLADQNSEIKKNRYKHASIKEALQKETSGKCVYCESKIGTISYAEIEHMMPSARRPEMRFDWGNLTIACRLCNNKKSDYYDEQNPFLHPYNDDVENMIVHDGPLITWKEGNEQERTQISIQLLGLDGGNGREQLVLKKAERMREVTKAIASLRTMGESLKEVNLQLLRNMQERDAEYSGMVRTILQRHSIV